MIDIFVEYTVQMKKTDQIVLTIFGDGAANEGIFHESLNMAGIWDLPILYLCENNQYGMSANVAVVSAKTPFKDRLKIARRCLKEYRQYVTTKNLIVLLFKSFL